MIGRLGNLWLALVAWAAVIVGAWWILSTAARLIELAADALA